MEIVRGKTRVGWIGTGVMGSAMAMHCINAGFLPMTVYNRTASKASDLVSAGAFLAKSPREVAEQSDVVLTIVGYPSDVRAVLLDPTTGVLSGMAPNTYLVDLTTSEPQLAVEIATVADRNQVHALDAPVTGGDVGARNGTLSVLVGGASESTVSALTPILECFSKSISYMGPPGAGQHTKLANQITIASTMIGVCEGLLYAQRTGLDLEKYLSAISQGAAGSFSLTAYAPRILGGDFTPGFMVDHFVKDLGIALAECQRLRLSLPGLALAQQLYVATQAQGHGRLGTQALALALANLNRNGSSSFTNTPKDP